jgi:Undecaprenyl-phosphate glucose phosphotransferase
MLTALTFFYREGSFSRIVVVYFWFLVTMLMCLSHWVARRLLLAARVRGYNLLNVLIAGDGELGQLVVNKINSHPEIGFSVVGYLTGKKENVGVSLGDHKVLGEYQDLSRLIKEKDVDQLFIALPINEHDHLEQVLTFLEKETVDIKVVPDLLRYMNIQSGVEELDGLPIVNLAESPLYGWNIIVKRLSDVVLSSLAILVASPVMLFVLILIKLESKGPVFYRQERMGLDQNVFSMLKFRSMKINAEDQSGPVWAKENDDRRTRLGTFLRSTSLDELPQLFNVLLGDMSLVGPRPERPVFIEEFKQSIPNYMLRLKMKAGLTGWAQVNGWRGNTSLERRIECDLYYIKNWSMWFDIKIIFMTIWKGFVNRHAY